MRKYLFLLIVLFLALFSCVDDNSSYEAQEKEKVDQQKQILSHNVLY